MSILCCTRLSGRGEAEKQNKKNKKNKKICCARLSGRGGVLETLRGDRTRRGIWTAAVAVVLVAGGVADELGLEPSVPVAYRHRLV